MKLVTSCYGYRIEAVGIGGDVPHNLPKTLSVQHFIPVVMIDAIRSSMDTVYTVEEDFRHRLPIFVIEAPSATQLGDLIRNRITYSVWWNPMASFFILHRSYGCGKAADFLHVAWQSDVLNAKVLCYHPHDGRVIVTYNPFTSEAPKPWRPVSVIEAKHHHPLTLLTREYRDNEPMCENLDFDRTKDLGGYPIIVEGRFLGIDTHESRTRSTYEFWSRHERIFYTLSRVQNANLLFTGRTFWAEPIRVDIRKRSALVTSRLSHRWTTYPHEQAGLVIMSQFRGHKSQLNKILSVIDVESRIGLGVVYLITLVFLKLFVRQALVPALLNLVRITCDTGLENIPGNTATRMYLTGLLFFAVTMQGIYQGNLAALLTQQSPLRQVNTLGDLVEFGYNIYGARFVRDALEHPQLNERFVRVDDPYDCISRVSNDSSAACLYIGQGILDLARNDNLHVSSEYIEMYHVGFEIRFNWPLERRIDVILARLVEADVLDTWDVQCNPTRLSDFQIDEEVKKNKDFKIIELGELAFAFVILGIGLLCATITFVVELTLQYKCIPVDRRIIN